MFSPEEEEEEEEEVGTIAKGRNPFLSTKRGVALTNSVREKREGCADAAERAPDAEAESLNLGSDTHRGAEGQW